MSNPKFIIVACVIVSAVFKGCNACFRDNHYENKITTSGSSFYQECHCEEPGYTIKNLKWIDINDMEIGTGPGISIYTELQENSVNLYIPTISKTMSGTYKCVTEFDKKKYEQIYNLEVYDPLYFVNTLDDQYLVAGKNSMINCEARGEYDLLVSWYLEQKDGTIIELENSEKYNKMPQGLIVNNVTKEDAGKYKCRALVFTTGEEVDRYIEVKIMTEPVIYDLRAIQEKTVVAGESLTIECLAEGVPHPEYFFNQTTKIPNENETGISWVQNTNTIVFDRIEPSDAGTYGCYAYNIAGTTKKEITIEVLTPPEITSFVNVTDFEGAVHKIECNATGHPEPTVTVYYEKDDSETDSDLIEAEIVKNPSMLVLSRYNGGTYVCNASNEVDYVLKTVNITVLHKPYFDLVSEEIWGWEGKTINLSCLHKSNPSSVIFWRFQGNDIPTDQQVAINKMLVETLNSLSENYMPLAITSNVSYGVYECTAKNDIGDAKKTITLMEGFTPPAIVNASILELTATSVIFLIDGPVTVHGPEVIGFTAEYDEAANYNITDIHINRTWSTDRPYKLEKLKPNTTYYVRFAAVNEVGVGAWSSTMAFDTLEKSVPEPPTWEVNSLISINQVLKWKAPEDNGDPIDYYAIRYCPINLELDETMCKEERIQPTTELELTDLDYNTTYYMELVAHNSEGNSTAANITVTIPALEIAEPQSLLSASTIIGISVVIVLVCLIIFDLIFLVWRRSGVIASCCFKKKNKRQEETLHARDKKGLLRDNVESTDDTLRLNNGHKEYEYNKNTGIVTGKHSAV